MNPPLAGFLFPEGRSFCRVRALLARSAFDRHKTVRAESARTLQVDQCP